MKIKKYAPILLTFICVCTFLLLKTENSRNENLIEIRVVLLDEINLIKGIRSKFLFKFWTKNHDAEFVISSSDISGKNFEDLQGLKDGDELVVLIEDNKVINLKDKSKQIRVYSIKDSLNNYLNKKY